MHENREAHMVNETMPAKRVKREWLIPDQVLLVLPRLAIEYGLEEAVFLQQLNFIMRLPDYGKVIDGRKWIYMSASQWKQHFPFWSLRVIRKLQENLEAMGAIESIFANGYDRTKSFAICFEDNGVTPKSPIGELEVTNRSLGSHQSVSCNTKNTTKKTTKLRAAIAAQPDEFPIVNTVKTLRESGLDMTVKDGRDLVSDVMAYFVYKMNVGDSTTSIKAADVIAYYLGSKPAINQLALLVLNLWDMYTWYQKTYPELNPPIKRGSVVKYFAEWKATVRKNGGVQETVPDDVVQWGTLEDGTTRPLLSNESPIKFVNTFFAPKPKVE